MRIRDGSKNANRLPRQGIVPGQGLRGHHVQSGGAEGPAREGLAEVGLVHNTLEKKKKKKVDARRSARDRGPGSPPLAVLTKIASFLIQPKVVLLNN